ncbi:MAG: hypothetical protein RL016_564 [Actinomycetota bacterium]|jgi:hypothetical protein
MSISTTNQVFSRVLKLGALLIAAIAVIGGAIGYAVAGANGLTSALIGSGLALLFVSMTALSVQLGAKLPLAGFFGVVMGGWLIKLVGFIITMALLKSADFINGPVLFFTIVGSVLGALAIDAVVVMRSRIPTYQK